MFMISVAGAGAAAGAVGNRASSAALMMASNVWREVTIISSIGVGLLCFCCQFFQILKQIPGPAVYIQDWFEDTPLLPFPKRSRFNPEQFSRFLAR
jgi:hypothetical protein